MARVNICGFETGDASECNTGTSSGTIQTTTVRSGQYALQCNAVSTNVSSAAFVGISADGTPNNSTSIATSYTRFYFLFLTLPASQTEVIFSVLDSSNNLKFELRIDSTGKLSAWANTTQIGSTGTTVLSSGVWYRIEVSLGSGASNVPWSILVNGAPEISGADTMATSTNSGLWGFGKTVNRNGNTVDFYYDDLAIDDAAFPGPGSIVRLDPSADVAKTNWLNQAGSSTNEFQSVDDLASQVGHDTDGTYVTTATAGTITFTVSFPALSTRQIIGTINEIKALVWGRDTATALTWQISLRPSSNAATTTAGDFGASYALISVLYKTKGGTDALTIANVNTCQASIIKTQSQARELRCTAMALMLDLPGVFSPAPKIIQAVKRAAFS